jgi:hypothetical protein
MIASFGQANLHDRPDAVAIAGEAVPMANRARRAAARLTRCLGRVVDRGFPG